MNNIDKETLLFYKPNLFNGIVLEMLWRHHTPVHEETKLHVFYEMSTYIWQ